MDYKLFDESLGKPYLCRYENIGVISYGLQNSNISIIPEIYFLNNTTEDIENLKIEIKFELNFIGNYETIIERLELGKSIEIKPIFNVSMEKLVELEKNLVDKFTFVISSNGKEIFKELQEFNVLTFNQWSGIEILPDSIANFVTPNIAEIQKIKDKIGIDTSDLKTDKNKARELISLIVKEIKLFNFKIREDKEDIFVFPKTLKTPKEVFESREGGYLEISLLFSSILEYFGLNPFIIFNKDNIFVGSWLIDNIFESNVIYDVAEIAKRLKDGINDIEVLNSIYLSNEEKTDFEECLKLSKEYFSDNFELSVDLKRSKLFGYKPLPIKIIENGKIKLIDFEEVEEEKNIDEYVLDTTISKDIDKREIWLRNLLDLSKRNSLISFKPNASSLQIFNSDLAKLEDALSSGSIFDIREALDDWKGSVDRTEMIDVTGQGETIDKLSDSEFKAKRISTFLSKTELAKTLKNIYRDSTVSLEESGSSSLFLAMGFLKWKDPKDIAVAGELPTRYAPIILIPVELNKKSVDTYQLNIREEETQINVTMLEMLRQKFELSINGLDPLPQDENGVDYKLVLNSVKKAVSNFKDWEIIETAFLSNFSFNQFVMWNDLRNRFDKLQENKVVKAFFDGMYKEYKSEELTAKEIDDKFSMADILIPTSVDSSQLLAVIDATKGNSFVLHGPPGTGKSQTITNMIANALYNNKSVLFVAEKMAALNVVNERLSKIGLGDFCLEIHSNKIQKQVVLEKLEKNLLRKPKGDSSEYLRKSGQIDELTDDIKNKFYDIKKIRNNGKSLYDMIQLYNSFDDDYCNIEFEREALLSLNEDSFEKLYADLDLLEKSLKDIGNPNEHPLRDFRKSGFKVNLFDEVKSKLAKFSNDLNNFDGNVGNFKEFNSIYSNLKESNIKFDISRDVFNKLLDTGNYNYLKETVEIGNELNNLKEYVYSKYSREIENLSISKVKEEFLSAQSKFLFKGSKIKQALIPLNAIAINGHSVTEDNANVELDKLVKWSGEKDAINDRVESLNIILDNSLDGSIDKFAEINSLEKVITTIYNSVDNIDNFDEIYDVVKLVQSGEADSKVSVLTNLSSDMDYFAETLGISLNITDNAENSIDFLKEKSKLWLENIDKWQMWSVFYETLERLENYGFKNFVHILVNTDSIKNVNKDFIKNLSKQLIQIYIGESENLSSFSGSSMKYKMETYNEFIEEYEELCKSEIVDRILAQIPNMRTGTEDEARQLGNVNKAIQSKGRGITIRQLFKENSQVIKKLTPCMLMSPLSVSQYIDLDFPKFDLVIFDEASQIQTAYAIGAMSRAENCIIVGDPNQMPPTSFFSISKVDEENVQMEDLESLLEDCLAVNMPNNYLTCHYRSQSESLIAFSNKMYYGSSMNTFPSPNDIVSSVKFEFVDGVYDRGNTRTNEKEAMAIIEEIKKRVKSGSKDSIGVVTFNMNQQILIDDLLQNEFSKDPELEKMASEMSEPIFIKNLENVQGDERDVILFSISFAKDENGKFYQNFGPIAKKGGWRRLNVAVSRSKKEMVVFSSIKYDDINITSTSAEGVKGVKKFLEYAQKGYQAFDKIHKISNNSSDNVVNMLATMLEEKGYSVKKNVGDSNFNIPLAVVDPNNAEKYICAILMDNDKFNNVDTIRDKIRVIPSVLKMKGWNIYRLWNIDWYLNKETEFSKLLEYLDSIVSKY